MIRNNATVMASADQTHINDLLKQAEQLQFKCLAWGTFASFLITMLIGMAEARIRKVVLSPYLGAIFWAGLYGSFILSRYAIYFPLPRILTLGQAVGGLLPTSCEASIQIEGPHSLPCFLKRVRHSVLNLPRNPVSLIHLARALPALPFVGTLLALPIAFAIFVAAPRVRKNMLGDLDREAAQDREAQPFWDMDVVEGEEDRKEEV